MDEGPSRLDSPCSLAPSVRRSGRLSSKVGTAERRPLVHVTHSSFLYVPGIGPNRSPSPSDAETGERGRRVGPPISEGRPQTVGVGVSTPGYTVGLLLAPDCRVSVAVGATPVTGP